MGRASTELGCSKLADSSIVSYYQFSGGSQGRAEVPRFAPDTEEHSGQFESQAPEAANGARRKAQQEDFQKDDTDLGRSRQPESIYDQFRNNRDIT